MGAKIKCKKCGDIIESKYRHDFKECKCGSIFIDGGQDYCRIGGEHTDIIFFDKFGFEVECQLPSPKGEGLNREDQE